MTDREPARPVVVHCSRIEAGMLLRAQVDELLVTVSEGKSLENKVVFLHPPASAELEWEAQDKGYLLRLSTADLSQLPALGGVSLFFRYYRPTEMVELPLPPTSQASGIFATLAQQLRAEDKHELKDEGLQSRLIATSCSLILLLVRQLLYRKLPYIPISQPNRLIARFVEMVEKYYKNHSEVSFYARALFVTEDHLSRVCQRELGNSAKAVIQSKRFRQAELLLLTTSLTVKEISILVGFESADYFSRAFKKRFLVSPDQFRLGTS